MASMWGHGRKQKRKNHVLESVVFSWFAHRGLYVTPVGGKEGGKNAKNTLWKTCFLSWFAHIRASMASMGAREEAKTKKPQFLKRGFFVVCPYGPPCHLCGRKGRRKKRKTTLCKTWFLSWFAHTGLYGINVGAWEERVCVSSVVGARKQLARMSREKPWSIMRLDQQSRDMLRSCMFHKI